MVLTLGLTTQEIRVLQEFRRLGKTSMTLAEIAAIKHPAGGGEVPARSLATKTYLTEQQDGSFVLTDLATPVLSYDPAPETEAASTPPVDQAEGAGTGAAGETP